MTPGEAIRKHRVECVGTPYEIKNCRGDYLLSHSGNGRKTRVFS